MRPSPDLHVEWIEDEAVVLDQTSGQIHHLNAPAAVFLALVQELGYDGAVARLTEELGDRPGFEEELARLQTDMRERGILIDG